MLGTRVGVDSFTEDERAAIGAHWLAVAFERDLPGDGSPFTITVLDRPVVIVNLDGALVALPDRCSHRGARLSGGDVRPGPSGNDCLVCPYHGLHFADDGTTCHLPARPTDRRPATLDLAPHHVRVDSGIVWVCLADDPLGEPPDWSATDDEFASFQLGPERWQVMPTRVVENFNDLGHFPTVHAATFGDAETPLVPPFEFTATELGFDHVADMTQMDRITLDGPLVPIPVRFAYRHVFPFSTELVLDYDERRREWIQLTVCPVGPTESLVFQQNRRNFDLGCEAADIDAWHDFQLAVNDEDRVVLEDLRPRRLTLDGRQPGSGRPVEIALSLDDFTIAYRQRWRRALEHHR